MSVWRKSTRSLTTGDCVEVGRGIGVRDSKAPSAHLPLSPAAWAAFLRSLKS